MLSNAVNARRTSLIMVLVALALRLAVMAFLYPQQLRPGKDHWQFGYEEGRVSRSIAEGRGFSSPLFADTGPTAWMTPVYPYFLAGIFKVFGVDTKASAIAMLSLNALASALTCLPIFFFARESFGERVAKWAGWTWVFFPYAVYFPEARIWDTWLATVLLAILFLITLKLERSSQTSHWIGFGLLTGFAALTDPIVLSVVPLLGLWALYRLHRQGRHTVAPAIGAALAFILVVSPWFVRNYDVFHAFVPFRDDFGLELHVGNNGETFWWFAPMAGPWHNPAELHEYAERGELAYMRDRQREAIGFIRSHPATFVELSARRALYLWTSYWSLDRRYLAAYPFDRPNIFFCTTLTILALCGLWRAFRDAGTNVAMPYVIVLFFFPLVYYITHPEDWYRRPIDPMFVVLAVCAIASWRQPSADAEPKKPPRLARAAMTEQARKRLRVLKCRMWSSIGSREASLNVPVERYPGS